MHNNQLFHIIWTTFEEYPVWDKNGNWEKIRNCYLELKNHDITCTFSHELQTNYLNKKPKTNRLQLNDNARKQLKKDIEELCLENSDRIIDGLKIEMLHIDESSVEMLVSSNVTSIEQKIARLKSRTATLLSLKYPNEYFGKNTWGKGIWFSHILNKESLAVSILKK
ncbi:hypothetical protein [Flavobacterium pedocola]